MNPDLKKQLEHAASFFLQNKGKVRIISHYDCDGICSAAILIKLLNRLKKGYSMTIVPQLDDSLLRSFDSEDYSLYIFTDIGSAYIHKIKDIMAKKNVLILDHHRTRRVWVPENIVHVNPHLNNIDGSREVAGSGVAYLFAETIDRQNTDLSYLAIVGAIGDNQERDGFSGINDTILKKAVKNGSVRIHMGIKLFGARSKPLINLLRQSFDPVIPGITGSDSGVVRLLKRLDIAPKDSGRWRMLADLSEDEQRRLSDALVKIIPDKKSRLIGTIYSLNGDGPFGDARELSTVLNSCGRLDKATVGVASLIGDSSMQKKALEVLHKYKREILSIIRWYKKSDDSIIRDDGYMIINARDNVLPSMAGTFASIISYSDETPKGMFIMTLSRMQNMHTKVSLRMSGGTHGTPYNLHNILKEISKSVGGQSGGHKNAAGALIQTSREDDFIKSASSVLGRISIEEKIE